MQCAVFTLVSVKYLLWFEAARTELLVTVKTSVIAQAYQLDLWESIEGEHIMVGWEANREYVKMHSCTHLLVTLTVIHVTLKK